MCWKEICIDYENIGGSSQLSFYSIFKKILFILESESTAEREEERESQANSMLSEEPHVGLDESHNPWDHDLSRNHPSDALMTEPPRYSNSSQFLAKV